MLSKNDICCIIISYNPDDNIYDLIDIIQSQVSKIVIIDNSEPISTLKERVGLNNITIIDNNENFGIAKALNQGVNIAIKEGYKWALTFDQDSQPATDIVNTITEAYNAYPYKDVVGAIGVNFPALKNGVYYKISGNTLYQEKDYLITSGTLISIDAWLQIGGFKEDLFIDNVDIEYSLNLKKNGKVSLITKKWGMNHGAGSPFQKSFFGIKIISTNHNSLRRYYMARNHYILSKQYFLSYPYFILKLNYFFFLSLFKILLVEDNKIDKFKATFKGLINAVTFTHK